MRRIIAAILFVLLLPVWAFAQTYEYFGLVDDYSNSTTLSAYTNMADPTNITYTCPGSGDRPLIKCEVRCAYPIGGSGNIRMAIYDTSGNFVHQWASEVPCPVTTPAWVGGNQTFVDQSGSAVASPTLTGGTAYTFATSADGNQITLYGRAVTIGNAEYSSNDYTGGFPATYNPTSASSHEANVKCYVQTDGGTPAQTDYYVSSDGSGSDCTEVSPCSMATAVAAATSGSTVYFDSNDTWASATIPILTAVTGVTYDGSTYGTGTRATFRASDNASDAFNTGIIRIDVSNVTVKGFEVDGDGYDVYGIDACAYNIPGSGFSNTTIDNCEVHDTYIRGIYIGPQDADTTITDVTITNTTVHDITPARGDGSAGGIVIYTALGQANAKSNRTLVRNCTVYGCATEGVYIKNDADNVTVEFCNLYENGKGVHLEGADADPELVGSIDNATIRYNIIYDNIFAGIDFYPRGRTINVDIYGNVLYDNGRSPSAHTANVLMSSGDFSTSLISFYNNTFSINNSIVNSIAPKNVTMGDGQTDAGGMQGTPTLSFVNNIVKSTNCLGLLDYAQKITTHTNNLYYRPSGNLVQSGSTSYTAANVATWETVGVQTTDPLFTGGTLPTGFTGTYGTDMVPNTEYFAIPQTSPAYDTGATIAGYTGAINLSGTNTTKTRPQGSAYDIGAYEWYQTIWSQKGHGMNMR